MENRDKILINEDKRPKTKGIEEAKRKTSSKRIYQLYHVTFLHFKGLINKDIAGIAGLY